MLKVPSQRLFHWYKECLSGYKEALADGSYGSYNWEDSTGQERMVAVLKSENVGPRMMIDEKHIGGDVFTIFSNQENGKIALMAETQDVMSLDTLLNELGPVVDNVEEVTMDFSPSYKKVIQQVMPEAVLVGDKFHTLQSCFESLQDMRIRIKQEELTKMNELKNSNKCYKIPREKNGETIIEIITRSKRSLYKYDKELSEEQKTRMSILFDRYPELKKAYQWITDFRKWYKIDNHKNILQLEKELEEWCEEIEDDKIQEMKNLANMIDRHKEMILNYFNKGGTNAKAENLNSRIQRFLITNYGIRNKKFFLFRLGIYFS